MTEREDDVMKQPNVDSPRINAQITHLHHQIVHFILLALTLCLLFYSGSLGNWGHGILYLGCCLWFLWLATRSSRNSDRLKM
jgi:Ca2+/Na+ antiporter